MKTDPSKKLGIVNVLMVISFLIKLKKEVPKLFQKGESIFAKVLKFAPVIGEGENFMEALPAAKDEFLDLDEEEKAEIKQYVKDNFDLKEELTEQKVERLFNWALETFDTAVDVF